VSANAGGHLLRSILHEWPSYLAFVTSFLTIGVIWLQHAGITNALRTADATLYRLDLLVLLLVSFLPFPTRLTAEFIGETSPERVAVVFYGLNLLALNGAMLAFVRYAAENRQLVKESVEPDKIEAAHANAPSLLLYGVGIVLSFLLPTVAVVSYLLSAVNRGLPTRTVHRLLRQG
jgi:uncharacterized membrane protein